MKRERECPKLPTNFSIRFRGNMWYKISHLHINNVTFISKINSIHITAIKAKFVQFRNHFLDMILLYSKISNNYYETFELNEYQY